MWVVPAGSSIHCSIMARNVTLNGGEAIHYDLSADDDALGGPYVLAELPRHPSES